MAGHKIVKRYRCAPDYFEIFEIKWGPLLYVCIKDYNGSIENLTLNILIIVQFLLSFRQFLSVEAISLHRVARTTHVKKNYVFINNLQKCLDRILPDKI